MNAFGLKTVSSEPVFRQRFDDLPAARTHAALRELNIRLLSKRTFGRVDAGGLRLVPIDIDVSPFDNSGSSKQGISFTYKRHDGYAPVFAYAGTKGYLLDCGLWPGKQHCQCGTPEFIRRSVELLDQLGLVDECLFRLDGGNDAAENMDHFGGHRFIIKRNLRKESREQWLALVRRTNRVALRETLSVVRGDPRHSPRLHIGTIEHYKPRATRLSGGIVAS